VVFLPGPGVKGGVARAIPILTDLLDGESKMSTDFRAVYTTMLEDWLGLAATEVLADQFSRLGLVDQAACPPPCRAFARDVNRIVVVSGVRTILPGNYQARERALFHSDPER
jgi:hypothetical protein